MKIKFENKKEKNYLKKIYDETYILDIIDILKDLSKKYNISNSTINVIDYGYDYEVITFSIKNKERPNNMYLVSFHVEGKKIFVRYPNQRNYDYYKYGYNQAILTKEGYQSADKTKRVEKVYPTNLSLDMVSANSQNINNLNRYTYNYYINNSKYMIKLSLPKNVIFDEPYFLNALLLTKENINDIIDLYAIIRNFLRTNEFSINIENQDTKELLTVKNGVILDVVKNMKEDNLDYTINYRKNGDKEDLEITHKVLEPENNKDMQKIKRKIR